MRQGLWGTLPNGRGVVEWAGGEDHCMQRQMARASSYSVFRLVAGVDVSLFRLPLRAMFIGGMRVPCFARGFDYLPFPFVRFFRVLVRRVGFVQVNLTSLRCLVVIDLVSRAYIQRKFGVWGYFISIYSFRYCVAYTTSVINDRRSEFFSSFQ